MNTRLDPYMVLLL